MNQDQGNGGSYPAERFIEQMGQHFEEDGLSRIGGRLLGYLMLSTEPQSLDSLAEALQVSKASVSTNTRMLESLGALERVTLPGDRRDYYQAATDIRERMIEFRLQRFYATRELIQKGLKTQAAQDPQVRARMEEITSFFEHMIATIRETEDRWARDHGEIAG